MSNKYERATVIDYWRAVEFFLPQSLPKLNNSSNNRPQVVNIRRGYSLPWEGNSLKWKEQDSKNKPQYQVYCGIYEIKQMRDRLIEIFGKDPESFDRREDGASCLFVFSADERGCPLLDSLIVSSSVWAASRTIGSPGPDDPNWLDGFDAFAKDAVMNFNERLCSPRNSVNEGAEDNNTNPAAPLSFDEIENEIDFLATKLDLSRVFSNPEIRIKTVKTSRDKNGAADKTDFLNSFYLHDLKRVADEIRKDNYGKGLRDYLSSEAEATNLPKTDVRQSLETLFENLAPENFPPGRWAGKDHHPLVSSQQFAVNLILKKLSRGTGLFAVNGPPGTGKTTLLRDLIAAIVVERAMRLAKLNHPSEAFSGKAKLQTEQRARTISLWREEFKGFEIVVASNNNGAVENVTMEIPGEDAIDLSWRNSADYFPELATRILKAAKKGNDEDYDFSQLQDEEAETPKQNRAWALIAARLGSKTNRNAFISHGWRSKKDKQQNPAQIIEEGLLDILQGINGEAIDWKDSVERFNNALQAEERLRDERANFRRAFTEAGSLLREINKSEKRRQELQLNLENFQQKLEIENTQISLLAGETEAVKTQRREHKEFEPSLIQIVFTFGRAFQEWREKDKKLAGALESAEQNLSQAKLKAEPVEQEIQKAEQNLRQFEIDITDKQVELAVKNLLVEKAKAELGKHFLSWTDWAGDEEKRELSAPWADRKWRDARALVFLEALNLHKAFIIKSSVRIMDNLWGAIDILSGEVPAFASNEAVAAAWTTLFFVVPVVSTTFASFDRLFAHLGRESLGWLFIDEAGQATPQSAVGAVWRAKRTVVVGDPLQLEPIITLPFTLQQALRRHYNVEETWLPGKTSVQQIADRVNHYGTELKLGEKTIWIGAPLRVHRRCARDIFDISNRVAYDGLMIFAERAPEFEIDFVPSSWIDVDSNKALEHWIPAEGDAVKVLLSELITGKISTRDIFLISPFRSVVDELERIAYDYPGLRAGTVHTVQGKEALIVILVLGSNPEIEGARNWAAEKPNLLNVAVSRAKERLYVIGNYDLWQKKLYFETLAEQFPK